MFVTDVAGGVAPTTGGWGFPVTCSVIKFHSLIFLDS